MSKYGVIAAGHPLTAEAAQSILEAGGNAFDAMIAALCTACVVEPVLASLGGGGFALVKPAQGKAQLLDFFTQTPKQKRPADQADFFAATVDFGSTSQDFHIGQGAIATPGMVSGLFALHQYYGSLPMPVLTKFAIKQAKQGVKLCEYQAYILSLVRPIFLHSHGARLLYESKKAPQQIIQAGELLRNPDLADSLETLAIEGEALFYQGEIAKTMVEQAQAGGHLSFSDLADYQTLIRQPLGFNYAGWSALTNPAPSAGGSLIVFALKLLETIAEQMGEFASVDHLRALREAMHLTSEARIAHTLANGTPDFAALANPKLVGDYQQQVLNRAKAWRGTTHISILDRQGNAISSTVSNGEGCGYMVPNSGIMLNNMLGEEDLNPTGFFRWQSNQRMSSMMAPTIALHPNGDMLVLGSGGSNRIRSAIVQVLVNLLHYQCPLDIAVQAPRLHIEKDLTFLEGGFSPQVLAALMADARPYRQWQDVNMFFGGVHAVARQKGQLLGSGDLRRGGISLNV